MRVVWGKKGDGGLLRVPSPFFRLFAPKLRLGGCAGNCALTRGSAPHPRTLHPGQKEGKLLAAEKDSVVHVAVVHDATCVRLPLTPGSLTRVAHTTHRLLGSNVVAVVIRMCEADSDMIHRLVTIGCGNGPPTECWFTHDIAKNQWDSEPVDRPVCSFL